MHYRFRDSNIHLGIVERARFNVKKMLTPPKSKSPWEAMTAGSTGGWAAPLQNLGPAITAGLGMIPGVGPLLATGMGAIGGAGGGGFQGTDYGIGKNIFSTLTGGLAGYGLGDLGSGLKGAIQGVLPGGGGAGLLGGFKSGMNQYLGTNIIPGLQGSNPTAWLGGQNAIPTKYGNMMQPLYGGQAAMTPGWNLLQGGGSLAAAGMVNPLLSGVLGKMSGGEGVGGGMGESYSPLDFNLENISKLVLGGQSALGGIPSYGSPRVSGNREEYLSSMYTPDLVQARSMIRDLALSRPEDLLSPASDEFINATLRQTREGVANQERDLLNKMSAQGGAMTLGKSGSAQRMVRDLRKAAAQKEADLIAGFNESRKLAAVNLKVNAISAYYGMAKEEAADLLASYGYINPIDAANYVAALNEYNTNQQLAMYQQTMQNAGY